MSAWLDRDATLSLLGVRAQTLYAYVSRKLLVARPDPADPRRSLYSRADAERLAARRSRGRRAADVAETTISWGEAILPTTISTVAGGRLFYRGRDAIRLAATATLEETAALLWDTGRIPAGRGLLGFDRRQPPIDAALSMLARAASDAPPVFGRVASSLVEEAVVLMRSVAASLGAEPAAPDIAAGFARRWRAGEDAAQAIRTALVLMADHELNASAFAARIAASTGAPLAAALLSGLATLLGPIHGGATLRVHALVEAVRRDGARRAVQDWLARGEPLAGFGHPLYPDIDPRAAALLAMFELPDGLGDLAAEVRAVSGLGPNIDFATIAMASAFGLPRDAPFLMFAAARTAGWLAHAMEQALTGGLIRPRARYVGPPLEPL